MKSRSKARAAAARQEILKVAARMMRERGYSDMSLRDLASEVGMKAGSLYYHFASKEELAVEVMRLGVEIVSEAVQEGLRQAGDLPAKEKLIRALEIHLETLLSASDYSSAHIRCYPFVPESARRELLSVRRKYDKVWNAILREYLGPQASTTDIRFLRHSLIGAMNWSLEWFDPDRDSVPRYVASMRRLLDCN